jgi:hypothetical protein
VRGQRIAEIRTIDEGPSRRRTVLRGDVGRKSDGVQVVIEKAFEKFGSCVFGAPEK